MQTADRTERAAMVLDLMLNQINLKERKLYSQEKRCFKGNNQKAEMKCNSIISVFFLTMSVLFEMQFGWVFLLKAISTG